MNIGNIKTMIGVAFASITLVGCHPNSHKQPLEKPTIEVADTLINVEIGDLDRNNVSIYDEIGKHQITIIDFWASWCPPCRAEAPNFVSLYNDYKEKGLGIVGISLDKDYSNWKSAIDELGLTWPHYSELRGWDNTLVKQYAINSIPSTIVVDANGKILAKGLRGKELRQLVADSLK